VESRESSATEFFGVKKIAQTVAQTILLLYFSEFSTQLGWFLFDSLHFNHNYKAQFFDY
jgi:hypothetical protein